MKRGSSLIELLIVISVITAVLVVLVSLSIRSVSSQTFSSAQARATKLAEEQLERARAQRDRYGLSAVTCSGFGGGKCSLNSNLTPVPTVRVEPYNVWFTVSQPGTCPTPLPTYSASLPKEVIVNVQWQDARPTPHQSQISSCLTDWRE